MLKLINLSKTFTFINSYQLNKTIGKQFIQYAFPTKHILETRFQSRRRDHRGKWHSNYTHNTALPLSLAFTFLGVVSCDAVLKGKDKKFFKAVQYGLSDEIDK